MTFESSSISPLNGVAGLYFVFSQTIDIQYPFGKSKLLYIVERTDIVYHPCRNKVSIAIFAANPLII